MPQVTSKDGTKIVYEKTGTGPAVVLVDGAFCFRSSGVTPRLAPLLSRNFTVYAYDRRGRGESGETAPYAVEREVEDLAAVVSAAGGPAYVCAFSSGCAIAIRAAAEVKPKKLVLFEPPYVRNGSAMAVPPGAADEIARLVSSGRRSDAVTYFMRNVFGAPAIFVTLMRWFGRESWKKNESVAHTLPYDLALMGDYSVPVELLRSVDVPTTVLSGEKSPAGLRQAAENVADALPSAAHRILPRQSHSVSMDVLAPVLVESFRSTAPSN